jgi:hypothetical protein
MGRRVIRQFLEETITLTQGQRLLVSVSLVASGDQHLCIAVCEDESSIEGTEFWSGAAEAPYMWSDMVSFGITSPFMIEATGTIEP